MRIFTFILVFFFLGQVHGQYVDDEEDQKDKDKKEQKGNAQSDRWLFGGNLQLQFGNFTIIGASPQVGYRITDRLIGGVGGIYTYYRVKDRFGTFETSIYGGSAFGRYLITEDIFANVEYNFVNLEVFELNSVQRRNVNVLFLGGGYRMPVGQNSSIFIMALFDVIGDPYSPYSNPTIRGGFFFGF
ncbi:hypothetical protein [Halocola ammonii]